MKLSICISTKDRISNLKRCIRSILNNTKLPYEIVVVDQSEDNLTEHYINTLRKVRIKYIHFSKGNLSDSKNICIQNATGDILGFIDDDCIMSKNWIQSVYMLFIKSDTCCVVGAVKQYKPQYHKSEFCPCITNIKTRVITQFCYHPINIGYGSNMIIKRSVFSVVGGFKNWLGYGAVGGAAEDAELFFRILSYGYKIYINEFLIVFHNKWLSDVENSNQNLKYLKGEFTFYSYLFFQGYLISLYVFVINLKELCHLIIRLIKGAILLQVNTENLRYITKYILISITGICVGLFYAIKDPVQKNTNNKKFKLK